MRTRTTGLAALLALASAPAAAQDSAKIGFVATFSGPAAVIGNDMRDAFELALDHLGRKVGGLSAQSSTRTISRSPRSASRRPTS
jgi:branched-chain amino acid transport system substrate-binding protein